MVTGLGLCVTPMASADLLAQAADMPAAGIS